MKGPIIVVGTGRSGTSTVSRILHEKLGVCMGHFLRLHIHHDYYEDLLAHSLNLMMTGFTSAKLDVRDWRVALAKAHINCDDWGFKDPIFLYIAPSTIEIIQPRFFIRTFRPVEQTVDSWIRHNKKLGGRGDAPDNRIHFHRICMEREMLMDWKLEGYPVLQISFDSSKRLTDEEIEHKIREFIDSEKLEEAVSA